jgi:hypothetical protein
MFQYWFRSSAPNPAATTYQIVEVCFCLLVSMAVSLAKLNGLVNRRARSQGAADATVWPTPGRQSILRHAALSAQ